VPRPGFKSLTLPAELVDRIHSLAEETKTDTSDLLRAALDHVDACGIERVPADGTACALPATPAAVVPSVQIRASPVWTVEDVLGALRMDVDGKSEDAAYLIAVRLYNNHAKALKAAGITSAELLLARVEE